MKYLLMLMMACFCVTFTSSDTYTIDSSGSVEIPQ